MSDEVDNGGRPPRFSQRHGYTEYSTAIQHRSLDERTRTDLWNVIELMFLDGSGQFAALVDGQKVWTNYLGKIWTGYSSQRYRDALWRTIFDEEWYRVCDLIEALVQMTSGDSQGLFVEFANRQLKLNRAGCRIVGEYVTEITDDAEITSVETAIEQSSTEARTHLRNAISLLANRDDPNFGKSISESMAAAEAAAREMVGNPKAQLNEALKKISRAETPGGFHRALVDGWISLYGFAGDEGGIRHAIREGSVTPSQELAQYFLVICSAFVNFVTTTIAEGRRA
ncbi:AbiJ-NTD4 domain-containing protein [Mycolicibacterium komossense]|uniref:AbiJ-NTD4 domain-containing protein n=1 Tax=Mycolicibacterium komossense TaxID=1779 RepID=UPI0021F33C4C|nr:hypothetical protein [Mycolicibacterium komossense]